MNASIFSGLPATWLNSTEKFRISAADTSSVSRISCNSRDSDAGMGQPVCPQDARWIHFSSSKYSAVSPDVGAVLRQR
ncbi:MAG UNVERIFIED_CONTAM: hypothetical protein LVR18_49030 [Planctomycetaceae bacterium]